MSSRTWRAALLGAGLLWGCDAQAGIAQITRIDLRVVESPAYDGARFDEIGQYERLRGVFYGEADPSDRRNSEIVDIDRAPRNALGRVEYATIVEIVRPVDMAKWNRTIYHTVPNRGGVAGDTALLGMGFALVQVGWQGDITASDRNIVAYLPIARNRDGSSIVGPALEEFIFDNSAQAEPGRWTATLSYPAASLEASRASLTVRQREADPRATPADLQWRYVGDRHVQIDQPTGFDRGAIYEFVYPARDPIVMGLGFAAVRDAISFLRYSATDAQGAGNPLGSPGLSVHAISFGNSQSGRFLRDMLYQGFNEDLSGRIVFDGMHPGIPGSRKTFTNHRFSQPGRWQKQHEDHVFPGDQFPFTYTTMTDPLTGRTDGLLVRCTASNTCPRIVQDDGEAELWQARASLLVTDSRGGHIELPDNVRVYLIAGTQHGGGAGVHVTQPGRGICQNLINPLSLTDIRRALTVALYEWVSDGTPPPSSRFPTVANGELVPANAIGFPNIPGVTYTGALNPLHVGDHSTVPPRWGAAYTVLAGRVDGDGNMVGGIRHPNLVAPIGTHTGWNLRAEGFAPGELCGGLGSFIPLAATRAERMATGDPRLSLEERYSTHQEYVDRVAEAAAALVRERLLLERDARTIVARAQQGAVVTTAQ